MNGYTYDPKSNTYTFPARVWARMVYRIGSTKEKIAEEDAREAERVRREARGGR